MLQHDNNQHLKSPLNMISVTAFAGQNWLVTPAALAVNQAPPQNVSRQNWILHLSGVTIPNLMGTSSTDWRRETLLITPDLRGPLNHAINNFSIPRPPGNEGSQYTVQFQVQQWAPFAAISSIFDQNQAVNAGFAVDVWRPNPFATVTDAFSNQSRDRIFTGIQVDVAVRDSDAILHRVSYNISLLGQVVFALIIIT
jgi:hypothetical protein